MKKKLSHLDQYKMLREEIMHHMREASRTEFWGITAAGAAYAWLIVNKDEHTLSPAVGFIGPIIILFCAFRVLSITTRMRSIAAYLRRIEEISFGQNTELPGWERHLENEVGHFTIFSPAVSGIVFWVLMFACSIAASWLLSP